MNIIYLGVMRPGKPQAKGTQVNYTPSQSWNILRRAYSEVGEIRISVTIWFL